MKLHFLGAAGTVTGSRYLLEAGEKKYLIDCGLFQGKKDLRERNWDAFPFPPEAIDAVFLTHAHLDHTGYLPLLIKEGFRGPVYATSSTCDLTEILLLDSAKIQEEDAERANRHGYSKHHPALPLYTQQDAKVAIQHFHEADFYKTYNFDGLTMSFAPAGHILGSAMVIIKYEGIKCVFSGDLGRLQDLLMRPPVQVQRTDYLVMESTYGEKSHSGEDVFGRLEEIIQSTYNKKGKIIIPAFAVGRTQTILYYLHLLKKNGKIPQDMPIYQDSPMAHNVGNLFCKYSGEHRLDKEKCPEVFSIAKYARTVEESKKISKEPGPCIIISSSGMAEGGRVLYHIAENAPFPENTILFAGFQAKGTRGEQMLSGAEEIKIHGNMVPIHARIEKLDSLSSHADYKEILSWLGGLESPPKEIFLTHGEPEAAASLKEKIETAFHWKVSVPEHLQSFTLGSVG